MRVKTESFISKAAGAMGTARSFTIFMLAALIMLMLGLVGACGGDAGTQQKTTSEPLRDAAQSLQATVDAMRSLTRDLRIPEHLMTSDAVKTGEEFDVIKYFAVLPNLSMDGGYTLDYVYRYTGGIGHPVLYARPEGKQPYSTYSEYTSSLQGEEQTRPPFYEYLDHIRTDGSADGFLQYVVLRLLADRFYLFWHAWLHSFPIIATSEALEELLSTNYETPQQPAETLRAARALDLEPTVEFNEDKVVVKVVAFNEWQGFQRQMFSITRRSPHKIVQHETETLVAWVNPAVP